MARGGKRPGAGRRKGSKHKVGQDVRALAQRYTQQAIDTLAEIMQDADAPQQARAMAADKLLDRGWGKPQQQHEISGPGGGPIPCTWLTADEAKALGWA